jgi:hypothetical protein
VSFTILPFSIDLYKLFSEIRHLALDALLILITSPTAGETADDEQFVIPFLYGAYYLSTALLLDMLLIFL